MISSLFWVPKGVPRQHPVRFELSPEEYERIQALAVKEEEIEKEQMSGEAQEIEEDALPAELRMDEYDNDDFDMDEEDDDMDEGDMFEMTKQGDRALASDELQDEEDAEDDEVKPSDCMIVAAVTEDDLSHLEVYIYSEAGDLFVHHDIALPDLPLSLCWMDCPPCRDGQGQQTLVGNYCAVGSFQPQIEIWNLDVLDPLEPSAVLGGVSHSSRVLDPATGRRKTQQTLRPGSHEAAVMGLSWNKCFRQALASSSADSTVKVWDVTTQTCSHTFTHHKDKVQSVSWHESQGWLLASGAFDKTVALADCRNGVVGNTYSIASDIESMSWNPFDENQLYCSLEDGSVVCFDIRVNSSALFSFAAHESSVTGLSFSRRIPGMMCTASDDSTVKVWDVLNLTHPHMVAYKSMAVGKLFTLGFSADDSFLMAAGGDRGMLAVWESDEQAAVKQYFSGRVTDQPGAGSSRVAGESSNGGENEGMVVTRVEEKSGGEADDSWMDSNDDKTNKKTNNKKKNNKNKNKK